MNWKTVILDLLEGNAATGLALLHLYEMGVPAWALPTASVVLIWIFVVLPARPAK